MNIPPFLTAVADQGGGGGSHCPLNPSHQAVCWPFHMSKASVKSVKATPVLLLLNEHFMCARHCAEKFSKPTLTSYSKALV